MEARPERLPVPVWVTAPGELGPIADHSVR
jgi:hypothetical protein